MRKLFLATVLVLLSAATADAQWGSRSFGGRSLGGNSYGGRSFSGRSFDSRLPDAPYRGYTLPYYQNYLAPLPSYSPSIQSGSGSSFPSGDQPITNPDWRFWR